VAWSQRLTPADLLKPVRHTEVARETLAGARMPRTAAAAGNPERNRELRQARVGGRGESRPQATKPLKRNALSGLTPELSRPAKRVRLERIVRPRPNGARKKHYAKHCDYWHKGSEINMPRKGERSKDGCTRAERQGTCYQESRASRSVEEAWTKPKANTCARKTSKAAESQCHKRRLLRSDSDQ
jgi:hypothetical protein